MYLVNGNNTKENFLWEPEKIKCQISQNDMLQMKFSEYYLFFTIRPVKFEIYILGLP